jgi:hypothetical protein
VVESICAGSLGSLGADHPGISKFPTSFDEALEGFLWVSCNVLVMKVVKKEVGSPKELWLFLFQVENSLNEETREVIKVLREHMVCDIKKIFNDFLLHPPSRC